MKLKGFIKTVAYFKKNKKLLARIKDTPKPYLLVSIPLKTEKTTPYKYIL